MYDRTEFPTSYQLAGRTPAARLGAIPGRLAPAAPRRSLGGDQRGRQPVAEPDQDPRSPSPTPLQASQSPAQIGPPAAATATGTAGPGAIGLGLSWCRLDPAQSSRGHPRPLRGQIPPFPGGPHPQAVGVEPPEAQVARNSGTKKPSGAGKSSAGRGSYKGTGQRPDRRLGGRTGSVVVA